MKLFVLILIELLLLSSDQAASFDCSKAETALEKMVCKDSEVSRLDEDMAKAYKEALQNSDNKEKIIEDQRVWLKNVRNSCRNTECLISAYKLQITRLVSGITASNPALKVFQSILDEVKTKTRIPILLPSELPLPIKEQDVHFADGKGQREKYEFSLFYDDDSGYAGFVGYFAGEAGGMIHFWKGKQVKLVNGAIGYIKRKTCGGSCSPTNIEWIQDKVLYTVQLSLNVETQSEEDRAIMLAANSAISGGPR